MDIVSNSGKISKQKKTRFISLSSLAFIVISFICPVLASYLLSLNAKHIYFHYYGG